jgi:hypothetical protein
MHKNLFYLLLLGVTVTACYPGGPEFISDYDLAATQHDHEFDFDNGFTQGTVVLSDSVYEFGGEDPDIDNKWDHSYDSHILSSIKNNLADYGWEVIDPADTTQDYPEAVFLVSGLVSQYTGYVWTGGGYCGWYWYYCGGWYPPYWGGYYYSYDVGNLVMEMFRYEASSGDTLRWLWVGGVNGLAGQGTAQNTRDRLSRQIDQCFAQSPYLNLN